MTVGKRTARVVCSACGAISDLCAVGVDVDRWQGRRGADVHYDSDVCADCRYGGEARALAEGGGSSEKADG